MNNPLIVLSGFTAALVLVRVSYLRGRGRIERRTAKRLLAVTPPIATVLMALSVGSWAAVLPLFIFGGLIGLLAAATVDQFWHPI